MPPKPRFEETITRQRRSGKSQKDRWAARDGLFKYPESFAEELLGTFRVQFEAQLVADLERNPDAIDDMLKFFVQRISKSQEALEEWVFIIRDFLMKECDTWEPPYYKSDFQFNRRMASKLYLDMLQMLEVDSKANRVQTAAQGFLLGMLYGYLNLRMHSNYLLKGQSDEEMLRQNWGVKEEVLERYADYRKAYEEYVREWEKYNPRLKKLEYYEAVGEKCGVSGKTIQRALRCVGNPPKNLRKPS